MHRLRPLPVAAFSALTLLSWVNRIWLAWTNADDTVAQKVVWSIPIVAFVVAAAVLLVALLRGGSEASWFRPLVLAFAAATTIYWAIRLPIIWLNDHGLTAEEELGFKLVHTVLAVVSVGAAALAARWARPGREHRSPQHQGSAVA